MRLLGPIFRHGRRDDRGGKGRRGRDRDLPDIPASDLGGQALNLFDCAEHLINLGQEQHAFGRRLQPPLDPPKERDADPDVRARCQWRDTSGTLMGTLENYRL